MKAETSKFTEGVEAEQAVTSSRSTSADYEAADLVDSQLVDELDLDVDELLMDAESGAIEGSSSSGALAVPAVGVRGNAVKPSRLQSILGALPRFDERVGRLLLSIILAGLLWFYVGNLENPERTTVYRGLSVEVRGLASNLKLLSQPGETNVTVQAPQGVLATLSQTDVRPYVDLGGYAPGVHTVPLRVDVRGGVQLDSGSVQLSPTSVQLQIEEQVTSDLSVVVRLTGTPAFGYGAQPAQANPSTVRIRGIPDAVSRVESVVVTVDIEDKAGTQQGSRAPIALDASGQRVNNVVFEPQNVEVVVPIKLLLNYKVVPVRVPVPGQPAAGYRVSAITYDPTNVTVCCNPSVLEPLQFIDTLPVSINGATSSVVTQTELILPPQVELYPGQSRVISVTVSIETLVTTLQLSVAPSIEGAAEGTGSAVSPDRLELVLAGTFSQLQGLNPSDVRAVVNLQERGPGTYTIRPQVVVPPGVTLQSANPETVTVTVLAPTPEPTNTTAPPSPVPTREPSPQLSPTVQLSLTPTRTLTTTSPTTTPLFTPTTGINLNPTPTPQP